MTDYALTIRYVDIRGPSHINPPDEDSEWEVVSTCAFSDSIAITWKKVEPFEYVACVVEHG